MKRFIFLITSTVLIKDPELFLHECTSILTDKYFHADSRMAPLTEAATLL